MKVTREREACLLGSAILAAVGAGLFADIPSAVDSMVHVEGTVVSHPRLFSADGPTVKPLCRKAHRVRVR